MHEWELIDFYSRFHPRWFESPTRYVPSDDHLEACRAVIPLSWKINRSGLWFVAKPPEEAIPDQGWKIHISVCARDSVACLRRALPLFLAQNTAFKFLVDQNTVAAVNSKLWHRSSGGKFITAYPEDEVGFEQLGTLLTKELHDFVGPDILSDRRWPGSGCVHYRYGGFRARSILQVDGTRRMAIVAPDGALVPDIRNPYWSPPSWVVDPVTVEDRTERVDMQLHNGRFSVTSALQFSNRGGVYKGIDNETGFEVVLKESRPHITIGRHAVDAIEVAEKEYRLLTQLADTGYYVRPVKFFREGGHAFLVEDFVPGAHLGQFTILNNPLYRGSITEVKLERYFESVRELWVQLAGAIAAAHQRGIVLGDLSFTNVIVTEAFQVRLLDLESAVEEGADQQVGLHTPGYAAPHALKSGVSNKANDYYSLGAIMFGSIMLANSISGFYPPARYRFIEELSADLALSEELIWTIKELTSPSGSNNLNADVVLRSIAELPTRVGSPARAEPRLKEPARLRLGRDSRAGLRSRLTETRDAVADYLVGTADVGREDRLFPADLSVFETNPLSVAFGASGVLYAIHRITGEVPKQLLQWLLSRRVSNDEIPPGLYEGQAGIAWVLKELGCQDVSVKIMRSARQHDLLWHSPDILHGASGYGLTCLKLWMGGLGDEFLGDAVRVGEHLVVTAIRDERGAYWRDQDGAVPLGYAFGGSGVSLFLLYLHRATGDSTFLKLARQALDFELSHAVWSGGEFTGFNAEAVDEVDGRGVVPRCYWDAGTAGVATTLVRHLAATSDSALRLWVSHFASNLGHKYAVFPQLFHGLAGLGNALLDLCEFCADEQYLSEAWQVAEGVLLFGIPRPEGIGFPGEQAHRESADFATGAAGVGLFLDRLVKADANRCGNFNFVVDELLPARLHCQSEGTS